MVSLLSVVLGRPMMVSLRLTDLKTFIFVLLRLIEHTVSIPRYHLSAALIGHFLHSSSLSK